MIPEIGNAKIVKNTILSKFISIYLSIPKIIPENTAIFR